MSFRVGDKVMVREDLQEGKYGADSVVDSMLEYCGKSFKVARVMDNGKINLEGIQWNWTPEMLADKPSRKIIGYHCLDTGGRDSWWTVGKVYKVYKKQGQEFIIDNERDERFLDGQSLEVAIKHQNDYYGTVFEPVYAEPFTEDLIERLKKEIERLNKDQENLFGKRDRINEQANQLGSKARRLEEAKALIEKYI